MLKGENGLTSQYHAVDEFLHLVCSVTPLPVPPSGCTRSADQVVFLDAVALRLFQGADGSEADLNRKASDPGLDLHLVDVAVRVTDRVAVEGLDPAVTTDDEKLLVQCEGSFDFGFVVDIHGFLRLSDVSFNEKETGHGMHPVCCFSSGDVLLGDPVTSCFARTEHTFALSRHGLLENDLEGRTRLETELD